MADFHDTAAGEAVHPDKPFSTHVPRQRIVTFNRTTTRQASLAIQDNRPASIR